MSPAAPYSSNHPQGFLDIYNTFGTMTPGLAQGSASGTFAADIAQAAADGVAADLNPALPIVVCCRWIQPAASGLAS
jgi:hypothetical protein